MNEYGLLGVVAALILVYGLDRRLRRLESEATSEITVTGFANRN